LFSKNKSDKLKKILIRNVKEKSFTKAACAQKENKDKQFK
jgi:hypothetical protein